MYYKCVAAWNVMFLNGPYFRKALPNSVHNKMTGFLPNRCLVRTASVLSSGYIRTASLGSVEDDQSVKLITGIHVVSRLGCVTFYLDVFIV
jgi:hypothetical protein